MTGPLGPIFDTRTSVEALRAQWEAQQAVADGWAVMQRHGRMPASVGQEQSEQADNTRRAFDAMCSTLTEQLNDEPKLFPDDNSGPIALLPVRIETIWWTPTGEIPTAADVAAGASMPSLRVRVYPDDVQLPPLDRQLTATEAAAAADYHRQPGPEAWQRLLQTVRPDRAAWTVFATRAGAPAPDVRPDGGVPPLRTVLKPDRLRFLGFTDGQLVVDDTARKTSAPLPLDTLVAEESWTTTWFEAVKAGMAIELFLPGGVDHLDQLFVVGVRDGSAADGAEYLQDLLRGHFFGAGLGFLSPGTATNNTPLSKSAWSTAAGHPVPGEDPPTVESSAADAVVRGLGLRDAGFLGSCSGAGDVESVAIRALTTLTWPGLAKGFMDASASIVDFTDHLAAPTMTSSTEMWNTFRDRLIEHVRSRGPLPTIRVGSQPYGLLPTSSLSDWTADAAGGDAETFLATWLLRLREKYRTAVGRVPNIGQLELGAGPAELMVDIFTRQPAATGITLSRMNGTAETLRSTPPGVQPPWLSIAGLLPDSVLRWNSDCGAYTDLTPPPPSDGDASALAAWMSQGPDRFRVAAANTADYYRAVIDFVAGTITAQQYHAQWPVLRNDGEEPQRRDTLSKLPDDAGLLDRLVWLVNWFTLHDDGERGGGALHRAIDVTDKVDQIVSSALDTTQDLTAEIADAARSTEVLATIERGLRALAALTSGRIAELFGEVLDVYSHRIDAWITSLASTRLATIRAGATIGSRVGCYGWVEGLRLPAENPMVQPARGDEEMAIFSASDGYVHAPSLQQATAAAVLRSGALTQPGEATYSVNLDSRRSRVARWLIGGVRQGQSLGALLGYRFERAMHDGGLDAEIPEFRKQFPTPMTSEPGDQSDAPQWDRSTLAIAARNVVDGVRLVQHGAAEQFASVPRQNQVRSVIEDVADALDAVADLLLAESVHHLVAGNPMRAGLAADALGRGTDVPDAFDILTTPHRARAVTHRLAVLLPDAPTGQTGWPTDAIAELFPALEAWVAHLLGPAAGWALAAETGDVVAEATLDTLGISALATVLDASAANPSSLRAAFLEQTQGPSTGRTNFDGDGWTALRGMALRIRSLLSNATAVSPAHLPDRDARSVDVTGLRERLRAFSSGAAVTAHPRGGALVAAADADPVDAQQWLVNARGALAQVLGADLPLSPIVSGPMPSMTVGVDAAELDAWLRRYAQIRDVARTFYDTLLIAGLRGRRVERLSASQDPVQSGDAWIGSGFAAAERPSATAHLVWHQPLNVTGDVCGLVVDEWVEFVPGADHLRRLSADGEPLTSPPESELTGVAFHYDRPDAKAPQAILVAVPPDVERGWTPSTLVQVLRETLELGKLRGLDRSDLGELIDLIPAVRIEPTSEAGHLLSHVEAAARVAAPDPTSAPPDANGPFNLLPRARSENSVDAGLAAKVHDPLWMFTRQWQLGEFAAQDAASPALVTITGTSAPINAWRPINDADDTPAEWVAYEPKSAPLDVVVESEPAPEPVGARLRAEGGAHLRALLDRDGRLADLTPRLEEIALDVGAADTTTVGLLGLVGVPDGEEASAALAQEVPAVAAQWAAWWAETTADNRPDCLDPHRFEYAFELSAGGWVLRADEYLGDGLDWYSVDVDSTADSNAAPAAEPYRFRDESLPGAVRYGGIPADRFWEMEDARIDFGATQVSTLDSGRLLLVSFATIYGNDWFVTPLEVPIGSLTTFTAFVVRDVFERNHVISRAGHDDTDWSMYSLHSDDLDHPAASGLLVMPTTRVQSGKPLERISLARDELANLAWAVQQRFTDGRGDAIESRDRWLREHPPQPVVDRAMPYYRVETTVPDYWLPLVPESTSPGVVRFVLADLVNGAATTPEGRLVTPGLWVHEEEIPREGTTVLRRSILSRWFDGSWHSWVRREKSAGTGESSSGLAFDTVVPTGPWPH